MGEYRKAGARQAQGGELAREGEACQVNGRPQELLLAEVAGGPQGQGKGELSQVYTQEPECDVHLEEEPGQVTHARSPKRAAHQSKNRGELPIGQLKRLAQPARGRQRQSLSNVVVQQQVLQLRPDPRLLPERLQKEKYKGLA